MDLWVERLSFKILYMFQGYKLNLRGRNKLVSIFNKEYRRKKNKNYKMKKRYRIKPKNGINHFSQENSRMKTAQWILNEKDIF